MPFGTARQGRAWTASGHLPPTKLSLIAAGFAILASYIAALKIILSFPIWTASILMFVSLPIYGSVFLIISVFLATFRPAKHSGVEIYEEVIGRYWIAGIAVVMSFAITLASLLLGAVLRPGHPIPQSFQMLFSNVIMDGVTIIVTLAILRWAVKSNKLSRIGTAISIDLVIAATLACLALWLGLVGTDIALTPQQVVRVFIAKSPLEDTIELGPFFWVMHTTLIPTIIYLSLIALTCIGKLIVLPVASVFRRGSENINPYHYTAGVFLFMAGVFAILAFGLGELEQRAREAAGPMAAKGHGSVTCIILDESTPLLEQGRACSHAQQGAAVGRINIADPTCLVEYLFRDRPEPVC